MVNKFRAVFFKSVLRISFVLACLFLSLHSDCQNPFIKCYFNHPVNTSISSGTNAVYLNGSFDDTIAAYINRAKYTVDIAQYDYTASASTSVAIIATAANNAVSRGVIVRWIYNSSSSNTGLSLLNSSIKTLGSPTTSGYGIMHNKFMIIDANSSISTDPIVMTGSYDWSTEQTNSDFNNMLFIQDKNLALAYYREFNKMWGGTGASPNPASEAFGTHKTASSQYIFNVSGTPVELYFSPKDTVGTRLQNTINSANYEMFFGIYTFTDNTIANLIKTKYGSGITVKGIMDQYSLSYSPYSTLNPVLGSNLQIYSGSYIYHNKIMVVDALHPSSDPQVFTGSFNWTNAAETSNDENAIIIHDASIANQYQQSLCQNFADLGGAACISSVVPLQLLYFKGVQQSNNQILLSWATLNEINNEYFEVEQSTDGIHYISLGKINGADNTATEKTYTYLTNSYQGNAYYRLKEVSNTNEVTYSAIITINGNHDNINIYPNPVSDFLTIGLLNGNNTIRISNYLGQVVKILNKSDKGVIKIAVNNLQKGIYTVEILNDMGKTIKNFIKE